MTVSIQVDDRTLHVQKGMSLLQACLENGIYIPNLCYLESAPQRHASCRMCFVAVEGCDTPVTACTLTVKQGLVVRTDTPEVRELQRAGLKMLLSTHEIDCKHCPANRRCALQEMARFLKTGLTSKPLARHLKKADPTVLFDRVVYYPNRCVLCGRCVQVCRMTHAQPLLTFAGRGMNTIISAYGVADKDWEGCRQCHACVLACPVGALVVEGGSSEAAV